MRRRSFLQTAIVAAAGPAIARAALPDTVRGLWVVRTAMTTPAGIDDALDRAAAAGLNTVLVQVRGRGDAFYASRLVPRSVLLERQPSSFDPLDHAIRGARARGLSVHAWFNLLLAAGKGQPLARTHVVRAHPGWLMVPRDLGVRAARLTPEQLRRGTEQRIGTEEAEGLYLSPFVPAVGDHLEAVVQELTGAYPLDGLHFDFVRYPGSEFDWSPAALQAWRRAGGRGAPNGVQWVGLRQEALTALVQRLSAAARATRRGLRLSAAVIPDVVVALQHRFQDWPAWASSGVLDAVCPMAYAPERGVFDDQVDRARRLAGAARVWAGIGAWRLDVGETAARARATRGLGGFVLFSHEWLAQHDPAQLRAGLGPRTA